MKLAVPSVRVQVELMSRLDFENGRRVVRLADDGVSQIILYDSRYIGSVFQLLERDAKDYPECVRLARVSWSCSTWPTYAQFQPSPQRPWPGATTARRAEAIREGGLGEVSVDATRVRWASTRPWG